MYRVFFQLFTNHKRLKYILTQKNSNNRHGKWLEFLANYDIVITYHSGEANVVPDALSKRPIVCGARLTAMDIQYKD